MKIMDKSTGTACVKVLANITTNGAYNWSRSNISR